MKAFFYSEKQAYLKIDGHYVGDINENLKTAKIEDGCFFEFLPKNQNFAPTYSSESGCGLVKTYPFLGGVFFDVNYEKKRNFPYKILSQQNYKIGGLNCNLTTLLDGAIKFYIDGDFFVTDELPFIPSSQNLQVLNGVIFAIFCGKKTAIYAYSIENGELLYKNCVDNFSLTNVFTTTTIYKNVVNIQIEESFIVSNKITLNNKICNKNKSVFEVNKNLVPLLLFDLVKHDLSASEILTQKLSEKQGDLKAFIGNVKRAFLNPYHSSEIIALYDNRLCIYAFEYENGSISNIIEKD